MHKGKVNGVHKFRKAHVESQMWFWRTIKLKTIIMDEPTAILAGCGLELSDYINRAYSSSDQPGESGTNAGIVGT